MATSSKTVSRIRVTQIRSGSGNKKEVKATLAALGLGKIGRTREFVVAPAVVGMIRSVNHLVRVDAQ